MINVESNDLQKLYLAYFGRPGDPSGINYWLSHSNKTLNLRAISNELSRQDEYTKYISCDKSFDLKINKLYLNLFNRKADFEGLNYWIEMVNSHNYEISDIVYELVFSRDRAYSVNPEQEKKDINILQNKILAAELFTKQISKSITLINLYQPDSISPWISGKAFLKVTDFLNHVSDHKTSVEQVENVIFSLSDVSLNILSKPAVLIQDVSLSIPIYQLEGRSLTKKFAKKVINITGEH